MPVTVELADRTGRSQHESWLAFAQRDRGITLEELLDIQMRHKEWLEEYQWRCFSCHGSFPPRTDPCPDCGSERGRLEMRNLYEANQEIIKPECAARHTSYVELLAERRLAQAAPVKTFVSHWWGEEFVKTVQSLNRYAQYRSKCLRRTWLAALAWVVSFLLSGLLLSQVRTEHWESVLSCVVLVVSFLVTILIDRRCSNCVNPLKWTFWICAFSNNQYALDHALGAGGSVIGSAFAVALSSDSCQEVAAVLDGRGEIYRRIWCAFELFFARILLTSISGQAMDVTLVNELGVIGDGDATLETIVSMREVISTVRTENAQASFPEDKENIERLMREHNTTFEQLDAALQDIVLDGLKACRIRRAAPIVLFGLIPVLSCTCNYGFEALFILLSSRQDSLYNVRFPGWEFRAHSGRVTLACLLFGVLEAGMVWWLLRTRPSRITVRTSKFEKRVIQRVLCSFLLLTAPSTSVSLGCIICQESTWVKASAALFDMFTLLSFAQLQTASAGMLLGVLYMCFRDWPCFRSLREKTEDTLLA